MLTRWVLRAPSRLPRTSSPSASSPQDVVIASPLFSRNFIPHSTALLQDHQLSQRRQHVLPISGGKPARVVAAPLSHNDDVTWSVRRNNLRNLRNFKLALLKADAGIDGVAPRNDDAEGNAASDVDVLGQVEMRIPDLPTAMKFDEAEIGRDVSRKTMAPASFTHDASEMTIDRKDNGEMSRDRRSIDLVEKPSRDSIEAQTISNASQQEKDPVTKNFKKKKKDQNAAESNKRDEQLETKPKNEKVKKKAVNEITDEAKRSGNEREIDKDQRGELVDEFALTEKQRKALQEYIERRDRGESKPKTAGKTKKTKTVDDEGRGEPISKSKPKSKAKKTKAVECIRPAGEEPLPDPQPVSEDSIRSCINDLSVTALPAKKKKKKKANKDAKLDATPLTSRPAPAVEATALTAAPAPAEPVYFSTFPAASLNFEEEMEYDAEESSHDAIEGEKDMEEEGEEELSASSRPDISFAYQLNRTVERSQHLNCYLMTCVHGGHLQHAEHVMRSHAMEADFAKDPQLNQILELRGKDGKIKSISYSSVEESIQKHFATLTSCYNVLMRAFLKENNLDKFSVFLREMSRVEMNAQTVALALIARARYLDRAQLVPTLIAATLQSAFDDVDGGFTPDQISSQSNLSASERRELKCALNDYLGPKMSLGVSEDDVKAENTNPLYSHPILDSLNEERDVYPNPYFGAFDKETIRAQIEKTLKIERDGHVSVEMVTKNPSDDFSLSRPDARLQRHRVKWRGSLSRSLKKRMLLMKSSMFENGEMSLWPFLERFSTEELVDLMMDQIAGMVQSTSNYNLPLSIISSRLGRETFEKYLAKIHPLSDQEAFSQVYDRYLDFLCAETRSVPNERLFWQQLEEDLDPVADYKSFSYWWPTKVVREIGRFLLDIILGDTFFEVGASNKHHHHLPVFYKMLTRTVNSQVTTMQYEIKIHPTARSLYENAPPKPQTFLVSEVPMALPPVPWLGLDIGGNVIQRNETIRNFAGSRINKQLCEQIPPERLFPIYDSLNHLGTCPWRVNGFVLDVAKDIFTSGGNPQLSLPAPRESFVKQLEELPTLGADLCKEDRRQILMDRKRLVKGKMETYSLWCTQCHKLSLAQHMRDSVLWYPINMDFRGRVYPIPPHLNHMGDDLTRGLLTFATTKALGPKGLDWLKIHVVNLTGLKKRDSLANRLLFANEMMEDILDSARRPLDGGRWWVESEEPWETLAACKEVADALACPEGPENFQSRLPVHQDGSCNGLQHYAALGRDLAGGISVNLGESEFPQDVYSDVLDLVLEKIKRDSAEGSEAAKALEGFVTRKVIKQTIMTTVYGVTRFGARLQVEGRLKELPGFPRSDVWKCSVYLSSATLECLEERFVATKKIQDWFNDIAVLVSKAFAQPVSWETALGLPVMQPYFKEKADKTKGARREMKRYPDSIKQKNGFPPNFIHSLDATHMMLTSLHAYRRGICFNAVHDCFWTHAADVDAMNEICRTEFVKLHSQPILEDLANHVLQLAPPDSPSAHLNQRKTKLLREVVESIPKRGDLDINDVMKSVYFFS